MVFYIWTRRSTQALDFILKHIDLVNPALRYCQVQSLTLNMSMALHQISCGNLDNPLCVSETERALFAFNVMIENRVSGIGIIDSNGILVDCISISDLRGFKLDPEEIWSLYGDVKTYRSRQRAEKNITKTVYWVSMEVSKIILLSNFT